jgi:peptidoglycan lytic transglycosylase
MYNKIIHRKHRNKKIIIFILLSSVFFTTCWYMYRYYEPLFFAKTDYSNLIEDAAQRHCIDPFLLKAVIWQESRFQANIRGKNNEIGLMQIRPEYGAVTDWLNEHEAKIACEGVLFKPDLNIEIGSWYLGRALKRWTGYKYQYELALSEYNAGLKGMQPWVPRNYDGEVIEHITIPSTKAYIQAIMKRYEYYAERREVK